jgi:hypothetical protein
MRKVAVSILAMVGFWGSGLANQPEFTFFTAPNLRVAEPTINTVAINTGVPILDAALVFLARDALGLPVTPGSQGQQMTLSQLLGRVCVAHEGRALGHLVCPLNSLYRRTINLINSLGDRAGNLANDVLNEFLGRLGAALNAHVNHLLAGTVGANVINSVATALWETEAWLANTINTVEWELRRMASQTTNSWIASIFPEQMINLDPPPTRTYGPVDGLVVPPPNPRNAPDTLPASPVPVPQAVSPAQRAQAEEQVGDLLKTMQAANIHANLSAQQAEQTRQGLRTLGAEVNRLAPSTGEVAETLSTIPLSMSARAEEVATAGMNAVRAQPSVRGVLVELGEMQVNTLRMKLTSEDRLVELVRAQVMAQASTNQILAKQTQMILRRQMEDLEVLRGEGRMAAEALVEEMYRTDAMLNGMFQLPIELSRRQAEMSNFY